MPKFQKSTNYQMKQSPALFFGGLFKSIFGGRSSRPKTPTSGNLASFAQRGIRNPSSSPFAPLGANSTSAVGAASFGMPTLAAANTARVGGTAAPLGGRIPNPVSQGFSGFMGAGMNAGIKRTPKSTGGGGFGGGGSAGIGLAGGAIPAWMRSRRDRTAAMRV